ncbi:MAG: S-adenosylmethionine decarboxylase [Deltaproteobacteria bacterium]|nr:S-adenosylmethionine decarboxylase [Deltaproteobacteria bacterium]
MHPAPAREAQKAHSIPGSALSNGPVFNEHAPQGHLGPLSSNPDSHRPESGAVRHCEVVQMHTSKGKFPTPYIDHWVVECHGVNPDRINHPDVLLKSLQDVVDNLHLTRVSDHSHYFVPGVSTVIILSESHLSAHTWPETGYMHVDIVTCEPKLTRENLEREFLQHFAPAALSLVKLDY